MLYEELRHIAHRQLTLEGTGHTLVTTALVHEAYVKLVGLDRIEYRNRAHFLAIAAQAMRRVLVDYATRRRALKRGGGAVAYRLESAVPLPVQRSEDLVALDEALNRLAEVDPRQSQVVECRFFGGMDIPATAAALGISPATVKRDWAMARAWLNQELSA